MTDSADIPELLRSVVPRVGDQWMWEPEQTSWALAEVTAVYWNGEEVIVESKVLDSDMSPKGKTYGNDLSRWVEATVLHKLANDGRAEGSHV